MKQWFQKTLAFILAASMVFGFFLMIPGTTLTADAAYTGNAEEDVTVFAQGEDTYVGRFADVTRLQDDTLLSACYWAPVSSHAAMAYGDPLGCIKVTYGSADAKTWSEPAELITPEKLGQWGLGVWRDDAGNFYYNAEDAAANNASIQVEPRDPNLAVMPDGTVLLTFFMRVPTESNFLGKTLEVYSNSVFSPAGAFIMYSKDNGQSWSEPTEIQTEVVVGGTAKRGDIAVYSDGQILIPIYGFDNVQSNAYCGSCVLAELNEDGTWNFIRETRMWGATGTDESTYTWETEHAMAVTTLNGQEVTYDLIRRSGKLLISYDRGATWEIVAENIEGGDSWFEGAAEKLQQPGFCKLDGSNKLFVVWTQAIGTLGQRNVYGKIYTPGEDWEKTSAVLLYKNNPGGGNDVGDPTGIQLANGELFTLYYDVADRKVAGVFNTVDELTVLRSERELVSNAEQWKFIDMDFENYTAGDAVLVQDSLWMTVAGSTQNTVMEENGNKYISTSIGSSSASNACWWFNNISSDATYSFDFKMPDTLASGWQQIALAFGQGNGKANIMFNNKPGVTEIAFSDSAGTLSPTYQGAATTTTSQKFTNVFASGESAPWYTVKVIWDDYWVYVKIWEKGTAEPEGYSFRNQNANWNTESKIFMKVTGGADGSNVLLDNVTVSKRTNLSIVEIDSDTLGYRFDRDVTYELPVPVVTWSSSDPSVVTVDANGNLTYVGAGNATITATCNNLTATKEIKIGGWNFIDLDFENDAAGDWTVPSTYGMSFNNYNKTGATKTIVENGDNKYLKLAHSSRFVSELWFNAGPGATLQFDFRMPSTMGSGKWHQLNISLGNTAFNPQWQFVNSAGTTIIRLYDTAAKNAANGVWKTASWYTAKLIWNGSTATMQVWEQGKPETLLYNQTATHNGFTSADKIGIKYANNEVSSGVLLDNITISKTTSLSIVDNGDSLGYQFAPDVTTQTPVPVVAWSSSNENVVKVDVNGNLTYVGAGTATITAACDNLTASKEITVCAVSFDANGHGENPEAVLIRSGNTVTAPEMADSGDWIFKGWYNGSDAFDFSAPITESVTLTAKWENKNDYYFMDFEDAPEGDYLVQDGNGLWMDRYDKGWSWVDPEKYLVLSGAEGDATIDFWFNNVPNGSTLAFDFAMPTTSAGWDRLAIAIGSSDVNYSWRFEQWQGGTSVKYPDWNGNEQVASEAFRIGTWYSVKMYWDGNQVFVKLWEKGTEEPSDYTFITWNSAFGADNKVRLNYVTNAQSYLHLDNIHFYKEQKPVVEAWNITLSDDIGLNFAVNVAPELVNDSAVEITVEGVTETVDLADAVKNEKGQYLISVNLAAAQMTESVQVKTLLSGAVIEDKTYTVRQYADYILADENQSDEIKNLVRAMLIYGGKAQNYFVHNTNNYADVGIEYEQAAVPTEIAPRTLTGEVDGLTYYGSSMLFTSKNAVRYYFTLSDGANIADYTFTAGDKTLTAKAKSGMYYVDVDEINPQDLDEPIAVTVTCGTQELTVGYSAMHYIVRKFNSDTSGELKALLQAMYTYHLAAEAYLAAM